MDFHPNQHGSHEDEEVYEDRPEEADSPLLPFPFRQQHEEPSSIGENETSSQRAMSPFDDLYDLFGPNAVNLDQYFQNIGTHQPFTQEASTQPLSDNTNNIDDFDALFNDSDHTHVLGSGTDQMASSPRLPGPGEAAYSAFDGHLAGTGPDYGSAEFVGLPELNGAGGSANFMDEAYMGKQTYRGLLHSEGSFPPVPGELILKSNTEFEEPDENSVPPSHSNSHTASDASSANLDHQDSPAHSYHQTILWPGLDALLSDPEGLLGQQNTNVVPHQTGTFFNGGDSAQEHRRQWQDPAFMEYHGMDDRTHTETYGYQERLPQEQPRQHRDYNYVDISNGNWLNLEQNLAQSNELPYHYYPARRRRHSPLHTPYIQAADMTAGQLPENSLLGSNGSYPDFSFNTLSQQSRMPTEPYLQHQNNSYIYDEVIPFNTNTTGHQITVNAGNTSALGPQMSSKPNPRKRLVRSDEEEEDNDDTYVDPEDELEQLLDDHDEDGSTQNGDYAPLNQYPTKRRKTSGGYGYQPGNNHNIHHRSTSPRSAGTGTEDPFTTTSGTRHCKEKGSFGSESKWWARETPQNGLQVRERESDLWRHAIRHDDIRHILFRRAGNVNQYTSPRARGPDAGDETSYLPSQKYWSLENRAGWKNIYGNVLMRYERKDFRAPDAIAKPRGNMMYQGRVVVDRNNRPVLDWPMLPATLSTRFEGGFIEAIRRICPEINTRDFWARMPRWAKAPSPIGGYDSRAAPDISGINMRGLRFRQQNGLIAWTSRSGSQALKEKVKSKMSQADRDNNSTENVYM